jgi:ABC-type transport system substrate-binding protein
MLRYSSFGVAGALLHLAILGYTVALILDSADADWSRYWFLFLALDFPVSLGVIPVNWLAPPAPGGPLHDPTNFWWPLLYHGIVGTGWWYIVGWAIEHRVWRREPAGQADPRERRED